MAKYLIKLYPIDRFFFGSDVTFGSENENYFVRSVYFPQQPTLLGTLRYYLLQQNNLLASKGKVINPADVNTLIGETGFDAEVFHAEGFGIINELSPIFITGPDGEYFVQSREYGLQWKEDEVSGEKKQELVPLKLRKRKGKNGIIGDQLYYFDGFNSKTEIPDLLVNARTGHMRYLEYQVDRKNDPMNGIFIANEQVGIRLPKNQAEKNNKEKGFYKQIGYTMLPGYGFAFYAEIEKKNKIFKSGLVRMGADQSWFRIDITGETDENTSIGDYSSITTNLFRKVNDFNEKVVLLSDCYIERTEYNKYPFASVSTVPFQYIKTILPNEKPARDEKIFSLEGGTLKLKKSKEYRTLLKKGSVFYVNTVQEKNDLIAFLKSKQAFYQIGYNYAI